MPKHRKSQLNSDGQICKKRKTSKNTKPQQVNTNWSIDAYRSQYEPEEHWELRRAFMARHQHRFPEDELICLAQTFVNVELLHCRYPQETMECIKELASGVADEYRAKRRNKLQRTFVSASDAAASKVQKKGPVQPSETRRFKPIKPIRSLEDLYSNIVIMNNDFEQTQIEFNQLECGELELVVSKAGEKHIGQIRCGQFLLAEAVGVEYQPVKKAVKQEFLTLMSKHCYRIARKTIQLNNVDVERKAVECEVDLQVQSIGGDYKEQKINDSNIGFKLLQKLGWGGGSLGTKKSGAIVDPINCQIKIGRKGLGITELEQDESEKSGKSDTRNVKSRIDVDFYRQIMRNFRDSEVQYDMVFSNEFTKAERAKFHRMAQKLQLRTRSYGNQKDGTRQLVVLAQKLPAHEMLERILARKDPIYGGMFEIHSPENDKNGTKL